MFFDYVEISKILFRKAADFWTVVIQTDTEKLLNFLLNADDYLKNPPFAKTHCCLTYSIWHWEHQGGRALEGDEMGFWALSGGELGGSCTGTVWPVGALEAMEAVQCDWNLDDLPTWAVPAGCSAWSILNSKTQHEKVHAWTHEYGLCAITLKEVYPG